MVVKINETEFKLLRNFIEDECGIMLDDDKAYLVENRLIGILRNHECKSFGEFYFKLKHGSPNRELTDLVVDAITTNETSWFRDLRPFLAFGEFVLPDLYGKIREGQLDGIKVCSAGCSTGQEPYSLAMAALDFFLPRGGLETCRDLVRVLGVDVSHRSLETAKAGRYGANSMKRGMPSDFLKRYFSNDDKTWIIKSCVRDLVSFFQFNLRYPIAVFGPFHVVFLRNVIIYFSDDFKRSIIEKITRALSPGGYLFLGTGETPGVCSSQYEPLQYNGAMFYKKKTKKSG